MASLRPTQAMKSISVAALKSNLSRYLAAVKDGEEFIITSSGQPVAQLLPLEKTAGDLKIIPAKKPVSSLKKITGLNLDVDLVAELLADRRQR
jgi:prevent-host-death family protein